MQTPEEMSLYERGPLNCAKCLASFGDDVLLDGEPVLCPKCGHRTVPVVSYTPAAKRRVDVEARLSNAKIYVSATVVFVFVITLCSGELKIIIPTLWICSSLGFVEFKVIAKKLYGELGHYPEKK